VRETERVCAFVCTYMAVDHRKVVRRYVLLVPDRERQRGIGRGEGRGWGWESKFGVSMCTF